MAPIIRHILLILMILLLASACASPQTVPQPTPTVTPPRLPPVEEQSSTADNIPFDPAFFGIELKPEDLERFLDPTLFPVTPAPARETALVVNVIDGDTIEVEINGKTLRVNYLGMNAPDLERQILERGVLQTIQDPQPYAAEATERNRQLVQGKEVILETDSQNLDNDGSLLRYVYVGETMVNAELIKEGLASVASYPPSLKHFNELLSLQTKAKELRLGMWSGSQ